MSYQIPRHFDFSSSYFIAFFLALRDPIPSLSFTQMSLSLASISSTAKLDYLPLYCTCLQDTMPSDVDLSHLL